MSNQEAERRDSIPDEATVYKDPQKLAEAEARNGLLQYDLAVKIIMEAIERKRFVLRPSTILSLHREALRGISSTAGSWRPAGVTIRGSGHVPVGAHLVPELVEEMCDYVNEHIASKNPVHLASYVMWRLNWIHPFTDGNGRTSRMTSYIVLSASVGGLLPGTATICDQIVDNRTPYFQALESADAAWKNGSGVDISQMALVGQMLATQLLSAHQLATRPRATPTDAGTG